MTRCYYSLSTPFLYCMDSNHASPFFDHNLMSCHLHADCSSPRAVWYAVEIAIYRYHAVMRYSTLATQNRPVREIRKREKIRSLLYIRSMHYAPRCTMYSSIGYGGQPVVELKVQILQIPKLTAHIEVLSYIPVGTLYLSFCLCSIGRTCPRHESVMSSQVQEVRVVLDTPV